MHYLIPSLQHSLHKASGIYKKWQKKPLFSVVLTRLGGIVLLSALSGFIIVYLPAFFTVANPATSPAPATQKVTSRLPADAPTQTNPLFAAHASWSQDFTNQKSGLPDPLYWNVLVGPAENSNKEQQYYTSDFANLRVENGALRLIATHGPQPAGYTYGSARIETQGKQSFLYGRIDITARLPRGVGTWPAVWLLPANEMYAQKSPDSDVMRYRNGGEIDIIEAVGFQPGVMYGVTHTVSDASLHADGTGSYSTTTVPNASTDFNKYTLLWTPTSVTFAVNDTPYYTYERQNGADYKTWPFDQPFYLIANLAMGGTWGGMDTAHYPGNGIDNTALPASLDIRSIYYYPYVGSTAVK